MGNGILNKVFDSVAKSIRTNVRFLQADATESDPDGDSVQARDYVSGTIVSGTTDPNFTFDQAATTEQTLADITAPDNPTKEYICTVQNT
jgi:hypothetical protein